LFCWYFSVPKRLRSAFEQEKLCVARRDRIVIANMALHANVVPEKSERNEKEEAENEEGGNYIKKLLVVCSLVVI